MEMSGKYRISIAGSNWTAATSCCSKCRGVEWEIASRAFELTWAAVDAKILVAERGFSWVGWSARPMARISTIPASPVFFQTSIWSSWGSRLKGSESFACTELAEEAVGVLIVEFGQK